MSNLLSWEDYLGLWLSEADIEFLDNTRGLRPFRGLGSRDANMARAICDKLLNASVDSYHRRAKDGEEAARLRALVAQQREALCASLEWLTCDCPDDPVSGVTRHYGDECPIEQARAVLATEGDDHA